MNFAVKSAMTSIQMNRRLSAPRLGPPAITGLVFLLAGAASFGFATFAVDEFERATGESLAPYVRAAGGTWAAVEADGMLVRITGEAPSPAARESLVGIITASVSPDRIVDESVIAPVLNAASGSGDPRGLDPADSPRLTLLALREGNQIALAGQVDSADRRHHILRTVRDSIETAQITDLISGPATGGRLDNDKDRMETWAAALAYGLGSLAWLPRSSVTVKPDQVTIIAAVDSTEAKTQTAVRLREAQPDRIEVMLDIRAPRPVVEAFRFRAERLGGILTVDKCTAEDDGDVDRIREAARAAGTLVSFDCMIALGSPHPDWAGVIASSLDALTEIGSGFLNITGTDIHLRAGARSSGTPGTGGSIADAEDLPSVIDRVSLALEKRLPDLFFLQVTSPADSDTVVAEGDAQHGSVLVTLSPEGLVQLEGSVPDDRSREMVETYARAVFGSEQVHDRTELGGDLPIGWPVAVFSGLEALSFLRNGVLTVAPEFISVRGVGNAPDSAARVSRLLESRAREWGEAEIAVDFVPGRAKVIAVPEPPSGLSPEACENEIVNILTARQITFPPSSLAIEDNSARVIDSIAEILVQCPDARFEVQGYTDSWGKPDMNQALSLNRAEAVIGALIERRVVTTGFVARGFGEENPIADNSTSEGRQKNRRIAFKLLTENGSEAATGPELETASGETPGTTGSE